MFKLLIRVILFIAGVVCLLDAGLPTVTETLQVDGHTNRTHIERNTASRSTDYTLQLTGGHVSSITVGYQAYNTLHDGDTVTVKTSRIARRCLNIDKDGEEIYSNKFWKIFSIIAGVLLIAGALGWGNDEEGNSTLPDFD